MTRQSPLAQAAAQALCLLVWSAAARSAGDEGTRELPVIIVTAQKFEQALEEVPASVTALDGALIRDSQAYGFPDLDKYAANIQIALTPTSSDIFVRGFGTIGTNAGFEPSVAQIVDGVYYGRSNFLAAFFHDLDRLEILRGPQGTLFGKNSSAGVLNLVTAAPEDEFGAQLRVELDDVQRRKLEPVLNLPLTENLWLRLSGAYSDDAGALRNGALDRRESGVEQQTTRLRLRYLPENEADWRLDLGAFYSSQVLNNNLFQVSRATDALLALQRQYDVGAEDSAENFRNSSNVEARAEVDFAGVNLSYEQGLNGQVFGIERLRFTSISAWAEAVTGRRDFDADFTAIPVIKDSLIEPSPYRQISQELRFAGRHPDLFGWGREFSFVIGGFYHRATLAASDRFELEDLEAAFAYLVAANAGRDQNNGLGSSFGSVFGASTGPVGSLLDLLDPALAPVIGSEQEARVTLDQRSSANAAFGQGEWLVLEHWALLGGLRMGEEKKVGDFSSLASSVLIPLVAQQRDHVSHRRRIEHELSPKAGIKWQPSRSTNAYLTWSQGYKSGGFNALPLTDDNLSFEREQATSIELGTKALLFDGSLRLAAAAFTTDFEDLQVSTFRDASFVILNAAEARSRGVELDAQWLPPTEGTALFASLGYNDARYTRYRDAPAPVDAGQSTQDLSGGRLPNAPRWSASLVPSYSRQLLLIDASAAFALDLIYRGSRYLDVDLDRNTRQSATTEVNARLSLAGPDSAWALSLGAHNLTGEIIQTQVLDQPLAPENYGARRADRGRYVAASLSAVFR